MAEFVNNTIDRESLNPGDHIYAYRLMHTYSHHGIYIGGDRVVHYNRTKDGKRWNRAQPCRNCELDRNHLRGVVKSCVDCFLQPGHSLRRFQYGVSPGRYVCSWHGTCTTGRAEPSDDVVIGRANDYFNRREEFGDYHLFDNNCEAFALFCKTGRRVDGMIPASNQASAAIFLFNAGVKIARDRLLNDVRIHHGQERHDELKQMIDSWLTMWCSLKQFRRRLSSPPHA